MQQALRRGLLAARFRSPILLVLIATVALAAARPALAAQENKILTVTKDAVYGAACGLFLGGVTALVVDKDHRGDSLRWGIVIGAFAGLGYGIYEVQSGADDFSSLVRERSEAAARTRQSLATALDQETGSRRTTRYGVTGRGDGRCPW